VGVCCSLGGVAAHGGAEHPVGWYVVGHTGAYTNRSVRTGPPCAWVGTEWVGVFTA